MDNIDNNNGDSVLFYGVYRPFDIDLSELCIKPFPLISLFIKTEKVQ